MIRKLLNGDIDRVADILKKSNKEVKYTKSEINLKEKFK